MALVKLSSNGFGMANEVSFLCFLSCSYQFSSIISIKCNPILCLLRVLGDFFLLLLFTSTLSLEIVTRYALPTLNLHVSLVKLAYSSLREGLKL